MKNELFDILYTQSFMYRDNPPFTLASGKESPYYFDCKQATLDPRGVALTGMAMWELLRPLIEKEKIKALGGLTLGADPISVATAIAAFHDGYALAPLIVRKEAKKHGTQKWVEGRLEGITRVIVIDDVITTGGSTITAIERLREGGLEVVAAGVIIDRQEGGRANIEALGVPVMPLFTRDDFDARRKG